MDDLSYEVDVTAYPRGAHAFHIPAGRTGVIASRPARLLGLQLDNSTAAAAVVTIYDGADNTGKVVFTQHVPPAGAAQPSVIFGLGGVFIETGVYVEFAAGVAGTLYGTR